MAAEHWIAAVGVLVGSGGFVAAIKMLHVRRLDQRKMKVSVLKREVAFLAKLVSMLPAQSGEAKKAEEAYLKVVDQAFHYLCAQISESTGGGVPSRREGAPVLNRFGTRTNDADSGSDGPSRRLRAKFRDLFGAGDDGKPKNAADSAGGPWLAPLPEAQRSHEANSLLLRIEESLETIG